MDTAFCPAVAQPPVVIYQVYDSAPALSEEAAGCAGVDGRDGYEALSIQYDSDGLCRRIDGCTRALFCHYYCRHYER